jgi:hypothetical protein
MYELIEHRRLDAAAASITFSNIPQIYSDLYLIVSARTNHASTVDAIDIKLNNQTANRSMRLLEGDGTARYSSSSSNMFVDGITGSNSTANTFGSTLIYIPNYRSSVAKSISADGVTENNATEAYQCLVAALWNDTSQITSIVLAPLTGTLFLQNSSATLYGINRTSGIGRAPLAMGGYMSYSNGYWVHTFPSSGSFIPFANMEVEYLVIAGGGAGGGYFGGGGGAGGYRSSVIGELSGGGASAEATLSLTANTNYTVTVGAGGVTGNGSNSTFSTITATGGGRGSQGGGGSDRGSAASGGSGGGGGSSTNGSNSLTGAAGTANQGYAGGNSPGMSGNFVSGGGGGAGGVGISPPTTTSPAGNGGGGVISSITGVPIGRAGGGGGSGGGSVGTTSNGGGTGSLHSVSTGAVLANGSSGAANTGGGGGGGGNSAISSDAQWAGGSGIVIIRYKA